MWGEGEYKKTWPLDPRIFGYSRRVGFGGAAEVQAGRGLRSSPSVEGAWPGAGTAEEGAGASGCEPDLLGVL